MYSFLICMRSVELGAWSIIELMTRRRTQRSREHLVDFSSFTRQLNRYRAFLWTFTILYTTDINRTGISRCILTSAYRTSLGHIGLYLHHGSHMVTVTVWWLIPKIELLCKMSQSHIIHLIEGTMPINNCLQSTGGESTFTLGINTQIRLLRFNFIKIKTRFNGLKNNFSFLRNK